MLEIIIFALGRSNRMLVNGKRTRTGGVLATGYGWREGLAQARAARRLGYRFVVAAQPCKGEDAYPRSINYQTPRSSGRVHGPSLARVADATGGLPGGGYLTEV